MADELGELGYRVEWKQASTEDLQAALKEGPVIVNAGVSLVSQPARDLGGPGGTMHAMVVKGLTGEGKVLVNDPWSGKELLLEADTFGRMWEKGQKWMYRIHP